MNTAIMTALIENPGAFFQIFIVEPLVGAALAYGLVWLAIRPKEGGKMNSSFFWHSCGIAATVLGSAIFRIIAMVTFAGRSAYEPAAEGGVAGFYMLIVPAIVAAGYITWLKNRTKYGPVVPIEADFTETVFPINHISFPLQTVVDEERVFADIAQELETGVADKGLWTRLYAESNGDDKQTKVLYIKQRSERLIAAQHLRLEQAQDSREPAEESLIKPSVMVLKGDQQVTGIDWLEQVTGLNWLNEVMFCLLLFLILGLLAW